ncbi:L-threonylcarbamoyladenylate synthase [Geomicrobium sp. JCM 19038]|uniref:L-threonylcarbamoyladenylate synthase n=1 Tax=Geomicrobium sp. JCM 19038 TaxID=1460635 RepID=UPI00045F26A2|nr:L-threonylcarbamoyladenylate synthase [Geomicrobium sp. JCM 19038]GAK07020.1 YrdC/Sua5 family protein [Geomicrobium sp. JCM 19038]
MSYQHTNWLPVNNFQDTESVSKAVDIWKKGGLIAFPTETVYGLGANGLSTEAVAKIFEAKGRPSDNPLILHIGHIGQLDTLVVEVNEMATILVETFWPGPLTLVMKRKPGVPDIVTAGLDTVAVRMPDHPLALTLLQSVNLPIAAPSANRSGRPSPTRASHVKADLDGRIDAIIDGGATGYGLESTVVDVSGEKPVILRPGGVTQEMMEDALGFKFEQNRSINSKEEAPRSPGMKYRHYAPNTALVLTTGLEHTNDVLHDLKRSGKRTAVAVIDEWREQITADVVFTLGAGSDLHAISSNVYRVLREVDDVVPNVDVLVFQTFEDKGLGRAIMNRLNKAASKV